jgi:hypothetical protein
MGDGGTCLKLAMTRSDQPEFIDGGSIVSSSHD